MPAAITSTTVVAIVTMTVFWFEADLAETSFNNLSNAEGWITTWLFIQSVVILLGALIVREKLNPLSRHLETLVKERTAQLASVNARLEASESQLRKVIESTPSGMVMVNEDGNIVLVNAEAERLFGYDRHELIGKSVDILVPPASSEGHAKLREGFLKHVTGSRLMGQGRDLSAQRKDGSQFQCEIRLNPIQTAEGAMVLSAIVDVTERKRIQERFQRVVEAAPSGMLMIDNSGAIILVNSEIERLFQYSRDQLIGQPVEMLIPERDRNRHRGHRKHYLQHAKKSRAMGRGRDLHALRKDGSEFPVEIDLNPMDAEGDTTILASVVDITERLRQETRTRQLQLQEMVASAVASSDDSIITMDLNGTITSWNKGAERMFGYEAHEVYGQSVNLLVPAELRAEEDILARIEKGGRIENYETRRQTSTGTVIDVSLTVSPVCGPDGKIIGASKIARDITERQRARQAMEAALQEKNRHLALKDEFISIASHELRTPMSAIVGILSMIKEGDYGEVSDNLDEPLTDVLNSGKRLINLVNDILSVDAIDSGRATFKLQEIDVVELATRIVRDLKPLATEKQLKLAVESRCNGTPLLVRSDPVPLEQVFVNLLDNALKFTDAGSISIVIETDEENAIVRVSDTGMGISERDQSLLFEKFQQVSCQLRGKPPGTGLGLYLAKAIVQNLGGDLWLESSRPGEGSEFNFCLPLAPGRHPGEERDESARGEKDQSDGVVLH